VQKAVLNVLTVDWRKG